MVDLVIALDRRLTQALEWVLVVLFAVFLVLVCVLVVMRYAFATSILGGNEFVVIAFLFTSAIGGAVGISRREHIAITVFIDLLPIPAKKVIYIAGLFLIAVINGYLAWYSLDWIAKAGKFPWQPLGWSSGYIYAAVPLGCGLAILYCAIKAILTVTGHEKVDILWLPED